MSPAPIPRPTCGPGAGLVLVAPHGLVQAAAAPLASLLGLRQLPPAGLPALPESPDRLLADLQSVSAGWLLPLALDPGATLAEGGCWAEVLAAWRQPVLLLLPAEAVSTGLDRAYTALLREAAVPLLGLVQAQGAWCPEPCRRSGLPWLGWLPAEGGAVGSERQEEAYRLRQAVLRQWPLSLAKAAVPLCPAGAADPWDRSGDAS